MPMPLVWGTCKGKAEPQYGRIAPSKTVVLGDPINGPARPDTSLGVDRTHGLGLPGDVGSQSPVRMRIGGYVTPFDKAIPPEGNTGCRGTVYRSQRFPAISRIHPESVVTISTISRQSYNYVAPLTPVKYPFNAFGNPASPTGRGHNVIQIGQTIPPALEPPRWNYTGLSTEKLQDEHDTMMVKVQMMRRGMR